MPRDDRRNRYQRAPSAVPTAIPDDESLTPPPINVEDLKRNLVDTVPPPLREQIAAMAGWIDKLASERTSSARWDRLESKLASVAETVSRQDAMLSELAPQLDRWRTATIELTQQIPKLIGMVEGLTHHVRSIDARMRDLELEVRSLGERSAGQADDLVAARDVHAALQKRVFDIEQALRDKHVESSAIAKRDKWWMAKVAGLVGLATGALPTVIQFVRNHF